VKVNPWMLNYWCSGVESTTKILWKWKSDAAQLGNALMEDLEWMRKGFWSGNFRFCWSQIMCNLCLSKNVTNHRTETPCDPRTTLAGRKLRQFLIKPIFVILLSALNPEFYLSTIRWAWPPSCYCCWV
jgi:hypothetical protein